MSKYYLSSRSLSNLEGVHPDLVSVVKRAIEITTQDFSVIEGIRSLSRQKELVAAGKSKTMNSRHLTGHAVDIAPYPLSWDWKYFYPIADAMKEAARKLDVPIRWGANWNVRDIREWNGSAQQLAKDYTGNFPDGPHLEIPRGFGYD